MTLTIATLEPGADGVVARVPGGPTSLRLQEMGLVPGARVTMVRKAPFGDPLEVSVRGTRLVLRRADAEGFQLL